jgi:hypothetical protein
MEAYKVVQHLFNELHFRSCSGVYRPTPPTPLSDNTPVPDATDQPTVGPNDREE